MIAIISTARSGTAYTTDLLRVHGIEVGHEKVKKDGIVSWMWAVESFDVPYGDAKIDFISEDISYKHLTRNPLDTISSCQTLSKESWEFIGRFMRLSDNLVFNCMKYWYYWNLFCEALTTRRFKIEEPERLVKEFTEIYKISVEKLNSREHTDLTWDDLYKKDRDLFNKIVLKRIEYGY